MSNFTQTQTKTEETVETLQEAICPEEPAAPEQESGERKKKHVSLPPLRTALCLLLILGLGLLCGLAFSVSRENDASPPKQEKEAVSPYGLPQWIDEAYITLDGESRTGKKLDDVFNVVVHYVANPGTSAMANRNYFDGPDSDTSSHFIVGLEGEVIAVVPLDERSCATNDRNVDTVSVEVCHPDATGRCVSGSRRLFYLRKPDSFAGVSV